MFNYNHSYSDPDAKEGDVIRFGQYITLTTLPNEGGKVSTLDTHYVGTMMCPSELAILYYQEMASPDLITLYIVWFEL